MRKKHEGGGKFIDFACGKCVNCKRRHASQWSFRLSQEERRSTSAFFITLTYNTDKVPITKKGYMSLDKKDFQKYMKRLRKLENEKLKYYAVGEYGSKTLRPHYHIIIFNAKIENIEKAWSLDGVRLGEIHCGGVNGATIGYTLKYICKEKKIPMHQNDDRQKEFSLMSKGLGSNYLTDSMRKWHEADMNGRLYVNLEGGKKAAMPRYYKEKIYTKEELERINTHLQDLRNQKERELTPEQFKEHEKNKLHKAAFEEQKYKQGNNKISI